MVLGRYRKSLMGVGSLLLLAVILLAACGGTPQVRTKIVPKPTPTPGQGQQLLTNLANRLNTAKTLHGLFEMTLVGQTVNGILNSEVWNVMPDKSRTNILRTTLPQVTKGAVTITNGQRIWQYDPAKKVVYSGPVQANVNGTGGTGLAGGSGGQSQLLLNFVQSVITHSKGTLRSSTDIINGHRVYDVAVVPQGGAGNIGVGASGLDYTGDIFIDQTTQLPLRIALNIQGIGKLTLNISLLQLNVGIPDATFIFHAPAGVKTEPLPANNGNLSGSISFVQAQRQAGYHLLSIPADQGDYVLQGVTVLGAVGNQIYTLNYMKGSTGFTIAQGASLANLPATNGQQVSVRGTTASLTSTNGTTTLAWTEKGIGIRITGALSKDQAVAIAGMLS
jgi:outer membrane lipoprotein-sorting protein